jgi:hypothetical protein
VDGSGTLSRPEESQGFPALWTAGRLGTLVYATVLMTGRWEALMSHRSPSSPLIVDRSAQKPLVESKKTLHGLEERLLEAKERLLAARERLFVSRERLFEAKKRLRVSKVSTHRLRGRRFGR